MDDRRERLQADSFVAGQGLLLLGLVAPSTSPLWRAPRPVRRAGFGLSAVGLGGMLVAASSLGKGLTASPLPNAAAQVRTGGLYSRVRHPIYSGLLLFGAGRVVACSSPIRLGAWGSPRRAAVPQGAGGRSGTWSNASRTTPATPTPTPRFVPARRLHRSL